MGRTPPPNFSGSTPRDVDLDAAVLPDATVTSGVSDVNKIRD